MSGDCHKYLAEAQQCRAWYHSYHHKFLTLAPIWYWWRSQKVGKETTKTGFFPLPVEWIGHLSCLKKVEHPYESRLRHQYHSWCILSACYTSTFRRWRSANKWCAPNRDMSLLQYSLAFWIEAETKLRQSWESKEALFWYGRWNFLTAFQVADHCAFANQGYTRRHQPED